MTTRRAWIFAILAWVAVAVLWGLAYVPLLGVFALLAMPSVVIGAIACTGAALLIRTGGDLEYLILMAASVALLVLTGTGLQQFVMNNANHVEVQVHAKALASLREPVHLDSDRFYEFTSVTSGLADAKCGDESCFTFDGFDWRTELVSIFPGRILEALDLKPTESAAARLGLRVKSEQTGGVRIVTAVATEGSNVLGTMTASFTIKPSDGFNWLPKWLLYALENNPVAFALSARPREEGNVLRTFLKSVIEVRPEGAAPRSVDVTANLVSAADLVPPLVVSQEDKSVQHWWYIAEDRRCEGVARTEKRSEDVTRYVYFVQSQGGGSVTRTSGVWPVLCAGDAIYVYRGIGSARGPMLSRFDLSGRLTADISIAYPEQWGDSPPVIERGSLEESGGILRFVAREMTNRGFHVNGGTSSEWTIRRIMNYQIALPPELSVNLDGK